LSNVEKTVETARATQRLTLGVGATAIALILAPYTTDYTRALNEANTLRDFAIADYERHARGFVPLNTLLPQRPIASTLERNPADWPRQITDFTQKILTSNPLRFPLNLTPGDVKSPRWVIDPILKYSKPPTNGNLEDWRKWIASTERASYFDPDWASARLSRSRDGYPGSSLVKTFTVQQSETKRTPGEYTFRIELDVSHKSSIGDVTEAVVVEGDVESRATQLPEHSSVNVWLRRSSLWKTLATEDAKGEQLLPGLQAHWGELRGKNIDDAIRFMESKQTEIRTVSLLGISVTDQLASVAVPLAYFLLNVYLLLHLRFLRSFPVAERAEAAGYPWIGLYRDRIARWITLGSLSVAPAILSAILLVRYGQRAGLGLVLASGGLVALAVGVGFWAARLAAHISDELACAEAKAA